MIVGNTCKYRPYHTAPLSRSFTSLNSAGYSRCGSWEAG
jgi:hypothetical protein